MNQDLTVGKPGKVLFRYCLPLFASVIFQQLYNIADSFVCGKFVGNDALAAVGNSYEITLIFIAFAFGCNIGCSVVVARLFGARDYREMKTAVTTSLIAIGVLCAVLMTVGLLFCEPFLRLIHTPDNIMADSALYLRIYLFGLPFVFFYHIATGIFSALGDSKTPFWFLACSSLANIGMDILFVKSFGLGVAGVAYATFICQGVSCVLALFVIFRRLRGIETDGRPDVFSKALLLDFLRVAVPSSLQQSFISVGNIIIQDVINGFGSEVIAGYAAAIKLNNMAIGAILTFGNGMSNYVAQNIGAEKPYRLREGFLAAWRMVWAICLPIALLFYFGATPLICLFLEDPSGEALLTGVTFLHIVGPFYFLVSLKLLSDGVLRGTERMRAFMVATFSDLIIRVVLAEILSRTSLGVSGVFLPWPIGWVFGVGLSLLFSSKNVGRKTKTAGEVPTFSDSN